MMRHTMPQDLNRIKVKHLGESLTAYSNGDMITWVMLIQECDKSRIYRPLQAAEVYCRLQLNSSGWFIMDKTTFLTNSCCLYCEPNFGYQKSKYQYLVCTINIAYGTHQQNRKIASACGM